LSAAVIIGSWPYWTVTDFISSAGDMIFVKPAFNAYLISSAGSMNAGKF
jgi:hypothetical protein